VRRTNDSSPQRLQDCPKEMSKRKHTVFVVKYEDLRSPERRIAALRTMVKASLPGPPPTDAALECAFSAAEEGRVHRAKLTGVVTVQDLFNATYNATSVDSAWKIIGKCAEAMGYSRPTF
jgi:hypothetical protein